METQSCGLVVVGAGTAALEAAVAACQHGAERVVVLEKAPEDEFGGNARFSHTGFRWPYSGPDEVLEFIPDVDEKRFERMELPGYSREDFMADLLRTTQGRINRDLATTLVDQSNAALHWMLDTGIVWEPENGIEIDGRIYVSPGAPVHPKGGNEGGVNQLKQWREIALRMGVDIRYESAVCALHGGLHGMEGVRVAGPKGAYDLAAGAVILCSGGYQASAEKRARYLGPNADLMKVRGSRHNTGEVLEMALALGAKSAGHWKGAHATPIDVRAPEVAGGSKDNRYGYPFGITVNALGERFFDEGESYSTYTYAKTGWAVLSQQGGIAYQLYDQKALPLLNPRHYSHAEPVEAPTIADLARKIGIEPAVLEHTVAEFNAAAHAGNQIDASHLDGRATASLAQPKTNWALRLDEPPFRAYTVTGGITFTFGGLAINTSAEVIGTHDRPIPGLYASGDILGLFYHNYPALSGQTRNAVFSRLAGERAAK